MPDMMPPEGGPPPASAPPGAPPPADASAGPAGPAMPPPPVPAEPIEQAVIDNYVEALNAASMYLLDGALPQAPKMRIGYKSEGPAPSMAPIDPKVWVATLTLAEATRAIAQTVPALADLVFEPGSIVSSQGMKDATAKLDQLSRNEDAKKAIEPILADAMKGAGQEPEVEPAGEAPHTEME